MASRLWLVTRKTESGEEPGHCASLMIVSVLLPVACGGGSSQTGPPAQPYKVTVTATSGTLQHSAAIAVTVN